MRRDSLRRTSTIWLRIWRRFGGCHEHNVGGTRGPGSFCGCSDRGRVVLERGARRTKRRLADVLGLVFVAPVLAADTNHARERRAAAAGVGVPTAGYRVA